MGQAEGQSAGAQASVSSGQMLRGYCPRGHGDSEGSVGGVWKMQNT